MNLFVGQKGNMKPMVSITVYIAEQYLENQYAAC